MASASLLVQSRAGAPPFLATTVHVGPPVGLSEPCEPLGPGRGRVNHEEPGKSPARAPGVFPDLVRAGCPPRAFMMRGQEKALPGPQGFFWTLQCEGFLSCCGVDGGVTEQGQEKAP